MTKSRLALGALLAVQVAITANCRADELPPPEEDPKLVAMVDPALRWHAPDVPDDKNAWTLWFEAAEATVSKEAAGLSGTMPELSPIGASEERQRELAAWVKRNEPAIELLNQGLDRPEARLPAEGLEDDHQMPALTALRDLNRARLVRAELAAMAGSDAEAVDDVLAALRFADRVTMSEGTTIPWLVGVSLQHMAMDTARQLHEADLLSSKQRRRLIVGLEAEPSVGHGLRQSIRHEFWRFWVLNAREVAELREEGGARAQFQLLCQMSEIEPPDDSGWSWHTIDNAVASRDIVLFELRKVVRFGSRYHAAFLKHVRAPWPDVMRDAARISDDGERRKEAALAKLQALVKAIRGPADGTSKPRIGKTLNGAFTDMCTAMAVWPLKITVTGDRRIRAERRALAIALSAHVYASRYGGPPRTLRDIVARKLLRRAPIDPFSDRRLRYDRARRIVWSVGENGEDNGGKDFADDVAKQSESGDLVWRVTLPAATDVTGRRPSASSRGRRRVRNSTADR